MRTKKCPICSGSISAIKTDYKSKKLDKDTKEKIIVGDVAVYSCRNNECLHTWLPSKEEERIRTIIRKRTRYSLTPKEIKMIRESLPGMTKMEVADFLSLNSKAFVKWEQEDKYTTPSAAYDLLLRLVAYKEDNLEFIKKLHKKDFAFDLEDYELLRGKYRISTDTSISVDVSIDINANTLFSSGNVTDHDDARSVLKETNQEGFCESNTNLELAA